MARMVGARAYNSGNISINDSSTTALTFDSERFDDDALHDLVTATGRLTITEDGKYVIGGCIRWAANATGIRLLGLRVDGATFIANINHNALSSGTHDMTIETVYELTAGQYIELMVRQTSGGPLNVTAAGNLSPEFWCYRVG